MLIEMIMVACTPEWYCSECCCAVYKVGACGHARVPVCARVCVCCAWEPNGGDKKKRKSVKVEFILYSVLHISTALATHGFSFMNYFSLVGT